MYAHGIGAALYKSVMVKSYKYKVYLHIMLVKLFK